MNPYLEKTEYVDVQLTAISSIEKIMSDPTYGLVSRNHVLSYDKMVDFVSNEDTSRYPYCPLESSTNSYISLLRKLGLLDYSNKRSVYDLQIVISSTHTEVNTIATMTQSDVDKYNYSLPDGSFPDDAHPPHFNTEPTSLGIRYYEFLIIDEDPQDGEYDHLFIDVNMNKDFQDEVTNEIYGRDENNIPKSGFIKGDNFILDSRSYIVTDIFKSGDGAQILNIDAADIVLGANRSYSNIVLVISRLVLVEEFGNLSEKRLTLIMWEGNRLCS